MPVAVPGGKYIVFNRQKDKSSRIWRADADGKNAVQLTEETAEYADFNPQVTPDGATVLFQRQIANQDRSVLMKVPVAGGRSEVFYESDLWSVWQPRVSPDGTHIAFVSYDVKTFERRIRVATLDGNNFGKLEANLEFNLMGQFYWSPDSKSLTVVSNKGGVRNLWRMPVDGSPATPVTDFKSGIVFNFAWASDGKNVLLTRGNVNNDLILIRDAETAANKDGTTKLARGRRARPSSES